MNQHVVRNIYAHEIGATRLNQLVDAARATFDSAKSELTAFASFLKFRAEEPE